MMKNFLKNKKRMQMGLPALTKVRPACPTGAGREQAGMTLIELMVVLAIFLIVASLTIFDFGRFRSNVSLQNLADDVALSIRRAQGFAIGVVGLHSGNPDFKNGYGIHFTTASQSNDVLAGSNKSFIIFADINNDHLYRHSGSASASACTSTSPTTVDECYDLLTITTNDAIVGICTNTTDITTCQPGAVDISFGRPDPGAWIFRYDNSGTINTTRLNSIGIEIQNLITLDKKFIIVSRVGQISIQ